MHQEDELQKILSQECEIFKQSHINNPINSIKPYWYKRIKDIPNNIKEYRTDPDYFFIINNVNINKLISSLTCGNELALKEKILFRPNYYDIKTYKIIKLWLNKEEVVPPTILFHSDSETNSLRIDDGRHRINAALYFGETHIPIIVINNDMSDICKILDIDMLDCFRDFKPNLT